MMLLLIKKFMKLIILKKIIKMIPYIIKQILIIIKKIYLRIILFSKMKIKIIKMIQ